MFFNLLFSLHSSISLNVFTKRKDNFRCSFSSILLHPQLFFSLHPALCFSYLLFPGWFHHTDQMLIPVLTKVEFPYRIAFFTYSKFNQFTCSVKFIYPFILISNSHRLNFSSLINLSQEADHYGNYNHVSQHTSNVSKKEVINRMRYIRICSPFMKIRNHCQKRIWSLMDKNAWYI